VVDHKELVAKVWPGVFVEEINLRVHIAALRKALNTGEAGARYLINVPGRGYCFVAPTSRERVGSSVPAGDISFNALYQLPPRLTRMVGREETVREVCQKLVAKRFVSIVGPGGMGQNDGGTRRRARFADRLPRRRLFCGPQSAERSTTPGGYSLRLRVPRTIPTLLLPRCLISRRRSFSWNKRRAVAHRSSCAIRTLVLAGHGRLAAGKLLGMAEVPVIVARGWSENQKRAYVIADNRLTDASDWDDEILRLD
jgi:hypothetical protein